MIGIVTAAVVDTSTPSLFVMTGSPGIALQAR
jgi:hypothetical protein